MHWKYIKRVKKNGKWYYYYDKSANQLNNLQKDYIKAKAEYNKNFEKFYNNRYRSDLKRSENATERENVHRWYKDPTIKKYTKDAWSDYIQPGYVDRLDMEDAQRKRDRRAESIGGKVDKFMSKHGHKIVKRLNDVSTAINNGQRKLASLFKK